MVNANETTQAEAERALALSYAPDEVRPALRALLAVDATLADIVRGARDPMVGQMRLTWWHDALVRLDDQPAPAQPVLADAAALLLPRGVTGSALAGMIDGWEALLDPGTLEAERLASYASGRGARMFVIAGELLGRAAFDGLPSAGRGWALADLAAHVSDPADRGTATELALDAIDTALGGRWPRPLRALGALALLAGLDLRSVGGAGTRTWRLLRHRLTGR